MKVGPGDPRPGAEPLPAGPGGLCPGCANVKVVRSASGSVFLRCRLSSSDARFPKYPPQPVVRCVGHERRLEHNH